MYYKVRHPVEIYEPFSIVAHFISFGGERLCKKTLVITCLPFRYSQDFVDLESIGLDKTGIDEKILRASTWHSLHAIGGQLSPLDGCHGIEVERKRM